MVQPSILQELYQLFISYPEIEQTILFGSRARGDFSERSDIDLIIKAPTISKERWVDLVFRVTEEVNTLLGIDILLWEEAPEALRQRVQKEGRLLYERNQDPRDILNNLGKALQRLKEALEEVPANSLYIDGTIQRFELCIELFWKTLKRLLYSEGIEATTPKECLKKAYEVRWIENETVWLQMLRDRNETSHVYNEDMAKQIYNRIRENYPEMEQTYLFLFQRFSK